MLDESNGTLDDPPEKEFPALIVWTFGGKNISVEGSWDNWSTRYNSVFKTQDYFSNSTVNIWNVF